MGVEILRDRYGVPHCYATSERDAFFAQGWVHAADRLFQMDYDRRRARGRWAEVAGTRAVASDTFYRRLDLVRAVERDVAALAPATLEMLAAYAEGVNAWMARGDLGREFAIAGIAPEAWVPADSLLVWRVRHALMGSARHKLWRAVVRGALGETIAREMAASANEDNIACVPPGAAACFPPGVADAEGGSNNWVLAGDRTGSGLPLLCGDPHRELEAPNVYVQTHIACRDWDVLGIGMPGVPGFPHFGHNASVAWSITHAMADDQDLYEVTVDDYESSRAETIVVRDAEDVEVDVIGTRYGQVIGDGLALCWTATAATNTGFDAIPRMLPARTVDELFEAMRSWVEPANNLLAADVEGRIGYLTRGRLPRRHRPEPAWFPVVATDEHRWDGWLPFEELPRCIDPDSGFLFSANNTITADGAPYVGVDTAPPWRATRIVEASRVAQGATVASMEGLQRDVVSIPARRFAARAGWAPLDGWDGSMRSDSVQAAAYSVLRRELMLVALECSGLAGRLRDPRNRLLPGVVPESGFWRVVERHFTRDDASLLRGRTWDEALGEAITRTEAIWHGEPWGQIHMTAQRHPLADPRLTPEPVAVEGDPDTVMVSGYTPTEGLVARTGSVARYVFDVADWDRSGWVVPLGAAGDPFARHGSDQRDAWREGRLLPAPYTRAAVDAAAVSSIVISADLPVP